MGDSCPECMSPDIDLAEDIRLEVECQDCGWAGMAEDLVVY